MIAVDRISATDTRPLRRAVLRPNQPPDACVYPLDDHPDAIHLGVRAGGVIVGVASFYREAMPGEAELGLRLRGMAVRPEHRGRGIGRALLERGIEIACEGSDPPRVAWCNARTTVSGYYERLGFASRGGVFEIEGIGPHVVMARALG